MKKRKDSAFGIHFDFHALPGDQVADVYCPETIGKLLDRVHPDYVQFDTKGHAGLSSYPTKYGTRADVIHHDMLMHWRKETAARDIALYGHHSGLYDIRVAQEHPDWAVVFADGSVSTDYISVFSPYQDEILIPQLLELARDYKLDGAWLDGDCWALYVDYSVWAQAAWEQETGKTVMPKAGDADYDAFVAFQRRGFQRYVAHYIEALKSEFPDFQITSNWIYSETMGTGVEVPVDFLSGDYDSFDSVNSARHHARYFVAQHTPWDLMSWGQNTKLVDWREVNRQNKEPEQLMQEAAVAVALGGGYEFFDIVYGHGGAIQSWCIEGWGEVADFVREREPYCFNSVPVPEIGVFYSIEPHNGERIYKSYNIPTRLVLALQDAQFSTQMLHKDSVSEFNSYPVLVLPSAPALSQELVSAFKDYVKQGGKLIVDLPSMHYFSEVFCPEEKIENKLIYVDGQGRLASMETDACCIKDASKVRMFDNNYYEAESYCAYKCIPYGKGVFVFNMFDIGASYSTNQSAPYRAYIKQLVAATGYAPEVRVNSALVDVSLMRKDDMLLINLINMCGAHNAVGVRSFNEIPPLTDIFVEINLDSAPKSVSVQPEGVVPAYDYDGKTLRLTVDKINIHSVIVIK